MVARTCTEIEYAIRLAIVGRQILREYLGGHAMVDERTAEENQVHRSLLGERPVKP